MFSFLNITSHPNKNAKFFVGKTTLRRLLVKQKRNLFQQLMGKIIRCQKYWLLNRIFLNHLFPDTMMCFTARKKAALEV